MLECQTYGCQDRAGEGQCKERDFSNVNKFYAKHELAMKLFHNIGTGHTVEKFNFNCKMVCQHHVIVDLEHRDCLKDNW